MSTRIIPPVRRARLAPIVLVATVAAAVAWVGLRSMRPRVEQELTVGGNTMGGTWSVKLRRLPPKVARSTIQHWLQGCLDDLEAALTTYDEASPVRRFNAHRAIDWFPVPAHVAQAVLTAERVSRESDGAFDATIAPLVNLWGFGPTRRAVPFGEVPPEGAITAARAHVDYRKLHVRTTPPAHRKDDPELEIDLSAVGKGYAAHFLALNLDARGLGDYLIAVGGELRAHGQTPDSRPWPVGIEVPTPDTRRVLLTLPLRDAALSTSGDYRNFVDVAGQRVSHEIDPRTGRPVTGLLASVSVVHPDSAYADAMATGLMVLGPDDGFRLAGKLHLAALFVLRGPQRFETRATPEFERLTAPNPLR
jgi:thiamine biosynthesis lipoprotein